MSRANLITCLSVLMPGICFSHNQSLAQGTDLFAAKWQSEIGAGVFIPEKDSRGIHGRWAVHHSLGKVLVTGLQYRVHTWKRGLIGGDLETRSDLIGLRLGLKEWMGVETQILFGGTLYLAYVRVNSLVLDGPPIYQARNKRKGAGTVAGVFASCLFPLNSHIGLGLDLEYNSSSRFMTIRFQGDGCPFDDFRGFWPGF